MIVAIYIAILCVTAVSATVDVNVFGDQTFSAAKGGLGGFWALNLLNDYPKNVWSGQGLPLNFVWNNNRYNWNSCTSCGADIQQLLSAFTPFAAQHSRTYNLLIVGFNTGCFVNPAPGWYRCSCTSSGQCAPNSVGTVGISQVSCGCPGGGTCAGLFSGVGWSDASLQNIMAHEIGHGFGASHTSGCDLMNAIQCSDASRSRNINPVTTQQVQGYVNQRCGGVTTCVSGATLVDVFNRGIIRVDELRAGDHVRVATPMPQLQPNSNDEAIAACGSDVGTYDSVDFFVHANDETASCVRVCEDVENGERCVVVSPTHFVRRSGEMVQAGSLADAKPEKCDGYYSFYTRSGSFLTSDGAEVGCFAAPSSMDLSHETIHSLYSALNYLPVNDWSLVANYINV